MLTIVSIEKSKLSGEIIAPASKSVAHRALIASALSEGGTSLLGNIVGSDVEATMSALGEIGASFFSRSGGIDVEPIKAPKSNIMLNARESGSTLRFMIPVAAALGITAEFIGEGQLFSRPIAELIDALRAHGIEAESDRLPLRMSGKLQSGEYFVDGSISSQYVTGLLFALPLLDADSSVTIQNSIVSKGYIDLTLSMLKLFSIEVLHEGNTYFIRGAQEYKTPGSLAVEGDFSGAANFAVGGAINGSITLKGLNLNSYQSDRAIIDILENMGADITLSGNTATIRESELEPISINIDSFPDLAPILAIAMATAKGVSVMKGVDRLRFKESDRLDGIIRMLKGFSVQSEYSDDILRIFGGTMRGGSVIDSQKDHRLAMSAAIGGSRTGKTRITDAHCVEKSYPAFFADMARVGGKVDGSEF